MAQYIDPTYTGELKNAEKNVNANRKMLLIFKFKTITKSISIFAYLLKQNTDLKSERAFTEMGMKF